MHRTLICGSRTFNDEQLMFSELNTGKHGYIHTVIHGGAAGADSLAHDWAKTYARQVEIYQADWVHEGKKAGILRNIRMLEHGKPDQVIAFWDGKSPGTAHMIKISQEAGIPTVIVPFKSN